MDILHSGPEVALIIASWASELFLAALFLRVVILPSITQTNARFWGMVSSRAPGDNCLIFEDVYDRAVDSWIVVPVGKWAQQPWVSRHWVSACRQYMIAQAQRACRMIPRHLRELRLPSVPIRSFVGELSVISEALICAWVVALRAIKYLAQIVVTSIRGLSAMWYPRNHQTPEDVKREIPDETEGCLASSFRSIQSVSSRSVSRSTASSTWKLLSPGPRAKMFSTPRYDLRRTDPGFRSSLKMPRTKIVNKRHNLIVETGWQPKDLEPEYWHLSPQRQGMGFFKRKAGMHSPRIRRVVLLNRIRPSSISRPLWEERKNLVQDEPETPIRSRHKRKVAFALPEQSQTKAPEESKTYSMGQEGKSVQDTVTQPQTEAPEQSTADSVGQDQWVPDMHVELSTPVPSIRNLQHRDPRRVLSASHLHQLQEMLIWIHCDFIKLSSNSGTLISSVPETFGFHEVSAVKNALQAVVDEVSMFGNAEDLRGFGASFFGSLVGLLDSLISQLHSALLLFEYNPACKCICERAIIAAQTISAELMAARAVATMQKRQAGLANEFVNGEFMTVGEV